MKIDRPVKRTNAPIVVSIGCPDHQENSLMKILFVYIIIVMKKRQGLTKVLVSLASS